MEGGKWSLMDYLHATPFSLSPRLFEKGALHSTKTTPSSLLQEKRSHDGMGRIRIGISERQHDFWKRGKLKNRRMGISNKEPGK